MDPSPPIGTAMTLAPGLRRIIAPNASPMTYWGTNTYLIGESDIAVIDPGPDDPDHLAALLTAADGRISHIFVTHSHLDHSPLAAPLSKATGAPVLAFGDSDSGKSDVMRRLEARGLTGGGEGVDRSFRPDKHLQDGAVVATSDWRIEALHTPGHMGNHLSFRWGDLIFTGDLVMGWASTMVSPPDGDLSDFLASCERLRGLDAARLFPGHGAPIDDPGARLDWLVSHRAARTAQIRAALEHAPKDITKLTAEIYADAPKALHAAAARNVFAHLIEMHEKGEVTAKPDLQLNSVFSLSTGR